jgi:uncharacterized protein YutE (UPF0331/DUF86 family)
MPKFNHDKVTTLVSELRSSLGRLHELSKLSENDFLKDPDKIGSAKYHFVVAVEACIDLGNHLIAKNGYRSPEDYADTFKVLEEADVINSAFYDQLKNMSKFRNRLVHLYWRVDNQQVYDIINSRLGDFSKFLNALSKFLNWSKLK